jgi:hypothetical protein
MKTSLFAAALGMSAWCAAALAASAPKIQFEQTVYDFGKTSQVETVSGKFKFKNVGDGILKVEPPKPSCGCTIAGLKPDTLKPGETGELAFSLHLGLARAIMEKHIAVTSNDPMTPEVSLTIKVDYTPLYDVAPMALAVNVPLGVTVTNQFTTITRTDGKPLGTLKFSASQPWITAKVETGAKAENPSASIRVEIKRDGSPRRFNEYIHVYTTAQTNTPISTIYLYGLFMGEVSLSPESLYWSVTDPAKIKAERPEAVILRRLTIRSADGKPIELRNPQSTLKGIHVELVAKQPGQEYELVAKLEDVPNQTISGNVSFETSVAAQSRIDVPVIVNVFKP